MMFGQVAARALLRRFSSASTTTGRPHGDHPLSPLWKGERVPLAPGLLGVAGLLPLLWFASEHQPLGDGAPPRWDATAARVAGVFGLSSLPILSAGSQARVRQRFQTYAASVLSFLGAVHWGLAMAAPVHRPGRYAAAVGPSLAAWAALNAPGAWGLEEGDPNSPLPYYVLGAGFIGTYLYDEAVSGARGVPRWYPYLRAPLTFAVLGLTTGAMFAIREPRTRRAV